jgi:hypothetical protein
LQRRAKEHNLPVKVLTYQEHIWLLNLSVIEEGRSGND